MKYGIGNYFSLPNEIFLLGLSSGELAVYSFLKRCENRKTHQCWPSYRTIGQAVRMSENTVRKYTLCLEERGLISTEPTEITTRAGQKRNGNLLYTLRPIQEVIDEHYDRQLDQLELVAARQRTTAAQAGTCPPVGRCVRRLRHGQEQTLPHHKARCGGLCAAGTGIARKPK